MLTKDQEFTMLINQNKGIIFKVCNSYCANERDRDDLVQEIIYNLWKSLRNFNPEFKFSTWMYRIALNVAISFYRQERKFRMHDSVPEGLIAFEEIPGEKDEAEANLKRLRNFINELKETDKAIILLYLDEKSHKEIAEITGFTETNVATRIGRIKDKIRIHFSVK